MTSKNSSEACVSPHLQEIPAYVLFFLSGQGSKGPMEGLGLGTGDWGLGTETPGRDTGLLHSVRAGYYEW